MPIIANLNTSSYYSILKSSLSIDDIILKAIENKQEFVSLADDNLYGAIEFYKKAIANGLKPVLGLKIKYQNDEIIIFAKNYLGYKNLIKISSYSIKKDDYDLEEFLSDVFVINLDNSSFYTNKVSIYSSNQNHSNRIAINTANYLNEEDIVIYNSLNYISNNYVADDICDLKQGENRSLKTINELKMVYDSIAINNLNNEIKNVDLNIPMNKNHLIKFPLKNNKISTKTYLKNLCYDNLNEKILLKIIDENKKNLYLQRIDYELTIIDKMNFNDYFLVVQDFVNESKNKGILIGPGRGSVAGSLVAYMLGITEIDSIKYNLVFERFLNPDRLSNPDIDIDIMDNRRNEVIEYIFNKYGYEKIAHIITFQRIKAKMAIRDVGRILGIDLKIINKICKLITSEFDENFSEALNKNKELKIFEQEEKFKELFLISSKIIGCPRQTGIHAAGIVLSDIPLIDIVPTQYGVNNEITTQYSMDFLEEIGLIKIDLLGLSNLTIINNIKKINNHLMNFEIDLNKINLSDQNVFKLLSEGHTIGIFQLESPGMTNLLKKIKPKHLEDISLCSALFRPGPQKNIKDFLDRKNGITKINYIHSSLKKILEPTYGIIVYQEQVINIVKLVANFSASQADVFRRIISKKKSNELEWFKKLFFEQSLKNNYSQEECETIYNYIYTFADYGFNHSHSISYALISYWMAYLKCYYPFYFMLALLNFSESNFEKLTILFHECKRMNIKWIKPNINESKKNFSIKANQILMGFNSIKGIGNEISKKIIYARETKENKKFKDYIDCVKTLTINGIGQQTIQTLIYAGMFDVFLLSKKYMIENLNEIITISKDLKKNGEFLFDPILKEVIETKEDHDFFWKKNFELLGIDFGICGQNISFSKEEKEKIKNYKLDKLESCFEKGEYCVLVKIKFIRKQKTKQNSYMGRYFLINENGFETEVGCFNKKILEENNFDGWYIVLIDITEKWKNLKEIKEKI